VNPEAPIYSNFRFCLSLNDQYCVFTRFFAFYSNINARCSSECPRECESEKFGLAVSSSDYPSRAYADLLVNHSTQLSRFFPNKSTTTYDLLREHLLAVNVYYTDMQYTSIEEVEKLEFIDLVAGIGGTMGLFLGVSFLSFFEIIDVVIETFFIWLERNKNKNVVFIEPAQVRAKPL
jgi:hypothetical protein